MPTYQPFDLERALAGEPVISRDGRKVKTVFHLPEATEEYCNLVAVIGNSIEMLLPNGRFHHDEESPSDLFMAPPSETMVLSDVQKLRAALAPFADIATAWDNHELPTLCGTFGKIDNPGQLVLFRDDGDWITLQHCFDARQAFNESITQKQP